MSGTVAQVTQTMSMLRIGCKQPLSMAVEAAKSYDFNQFDPNPAGRGSNIFGVTNGYDDDTVVAVMAQIRADLKQYPDPMGFTARIVFRSPCYRTRNLADFTVPFTPDFSPVAKPGATPTCVMLHLVMDFMDETAWYLQSAQGGVVVGGWDMRSRQRIKGVVNFYVQSNMPFAVRRTNTAGSTARDFAKVTGPSGFFPDVDLCATPLRGVTNFEVDGLNIFDSYGCAAMHGLIVESGIVAKIKNVKVYSTPGPVSGPSVCLPGSSAILIDGFSIQSWIDDNLNEYKEDTIRVISYTESLQWRNAGGSNCYRSLHVDYANFNHLGCYPNTKPTPANPTPGPQNCGLAWCIDPFSQLDATGSVLDLTLVDGIRIYGGFYAQHAVGGQACDGITTGDASGNCAMVFRACFSVCAYNVELAGPSLNGAPCVNGGKGLWMTGLTITAADAAKPNGPQPQFVQSQHLVLSAPKFKGWGHDPAKPPIMIDNGVFNVTIDNARWFADNADTLMPTNPMGDPGGRNCCSYFYGDNKLDSAWAYNGIQAGATSVSEAARSASSFFANIVAGQPINGVTSLALTNLSGAGAKQYDAKAKTYAVKVAGKYRILAAMRLPDVAVPAMAAALTGASNMAQVASAVNTMIASYNAMLTSEQRVALGVDVRMSADQDQWSQFNAQSTSLHLVVERYYAVGDALNFLAFANRATTVFEANGFFSVEYVGG